MQEEEYIKFHCMWIEKSLPEDISINDLNFWRDKLYRQKLIGAYADGVGYGNISIRLTNNTFLITGTKTGNNTKLTNEHYTIVTGYDLAQNRVNCKGPVMASSESLTHAILYESLPEINAVVHIHSEALWKRQINKVPTTSLQVEYGTPEMALEIKRLIDTERLAGVKILAMAGHKDGLLAFGKDLAEAAHKFL